MYYYRYVVLVHALVAILLGVALRAGISSALVEFALADNRIGGLVNVSTAVAAGIALLEFLYVMRSATILTFTDEVIAEIMRVTWPSRDEAVRAASTVIMTAGLMAVVISLYDLLWKQLADLILFNQS